MKRIITTLFLSLATVSIYADEGMWLLTDLKAQNEIAMKELGLQMSIDEIYSANKISLKDAVVHFDGGCTGEIISSEGLVLTNHHCGYGSIQQHSSVEHDYLTDGFVARNRSEELYTPDLVITFIDRILDVTSYVKEQLKKDEDPLGVNYLSPSYLKGVAARFAKEQNIVLSEFNSLELKPFYGGNKYYLFIKTDYEDVRMVAAPPSSIGKYGADTDNWMWPRHTGDVSFFRIYADKDGKPAKYSKDNVPLKVKRHIKINIGGIEKGDFAFVMGFPGRNWRYMISDEVEERMQTTNFMRHHVRDARQNVLMSEMLKDPAVRIHYASKYASSANYWKNAIGMNEGLIKLKVLDTKKAQQEELLAYGREIKNNEYQEAFDKIRSIVSKRKPMVYHQQAITECFARGMDFIRVINTDKLKDALLSKNKDSIKYYVEALTKKAEEYFKENPHVEVEKRVAKEMFNTYKKYIDADKRISIFDIINKKFKGNSDAFVDYCFDKSIFANKENFNKFVSKPSVKQLDQDPIINLAKSVDEGLKKLSEEMSSMSKDYYLAHRTWVKGMMELRTKKGLAIYPDANSTLRLTYGKVLPYSPADGVEYDYYTTLEGVMQKEDPNNWEFVVPEKLKELYRKKDYGRYADKKGHMPVCFIINTDNTGGNSGSPVFNAKGELIGTGFDRNYEGLTGDIAFRPSSQRAAVVDIRYTLFYLDKFAGAKHLIDEMDIVE